MKPFEINPDARYAVLLAAPVDHETRRLLPRDRHRMSGAVLRDIVEANGWEVIANADALA